MELKDFRIGNYYIYTKYNGREEINQISSIYNSSLEPKLNIQSKGSAYGDSSIEGDELERCKPLPLTGDIIQKCCQSYNYALPDLACFKFKYLTIFYKKGVFYRYQGLLTFGLTRNEIPLKYVHELQNAYWFLNGGEELEISL